MIHVQRNTIVGAKITHVLRTPWKTYDRVDSCSVFVLLDNGYAIELSNAGDGFSEQPLPAMRCEELVLAELEEDEAASQVTGQTITEVLVPFRGPFWTVGLALSNGMFLSFADQSSHVMGSIVDDSTSYTGDMLTYWGHGDFQ